jgi:hypothetical protein
VQERRQVGQLLVDRNAQSLKRTGRWMQGCTWALLHYLFNGLDKGSCRGYWRFGPRANERASKRAGGWFFAQLMKDAAQLGLTGLIHNIGGTPRLTLIHTHVQWTRPQKTEPTLPLLYL